ncbi:MAG: MFS transporter [Candidatus Riflebacteria bacterium]|nr:MFS transporter [Candidatus Riflebacteria bacterium]
MGVSDDAQLRIWVGILISVNFMVAAIMSPIWGSLADKFGKKAMVLRAVFGISITVGLMSFATTPWHLLFLRICQGCVGGFIASSIALMASLSPKEIIGYSLGTLNSAILAGTFVGPLLGGVFADFLGFRNLFLFIGACCFVSGILVAWNANDAPLGDPETQKKKKIGFFVIVGLIKIIPGLGVICAAQVLINTSLMMINQILPLFTLELLGKINLITSAVGIITAALGIPCVLLVAKWGKLSDRIDSSKTFYLTAFGMSFGAILFIFSKDFLSLVGTRFFMGIFLAGCATSSQSLVAKITPDDKTASGLSLLSSSQLIENATGPLLAGFLSSHLGFRAVFFCSFLMLFSAGVICWKKLG